MSRSLLILTSIALPLLGARAAANDEREGEHWWATVKVLADDKMEGRNTGSEGYRKAAAYVAAEFAMCW